MKISRRLPLQSGFTLVELLIVVTIIGILTVAVLAAINPIEQFNKARDTGRKTDSGQILNAIERYYTSQGRYPWITATTLSQLDDGVYFKLDGTEHDWMNELVTKGELKQSFVDKYAKGTGTLTQYETMHVLKSDSSRANKDEIVVCFTPQSLAIETERIILSTLPASNTPMSAAVPYTGFKQSGFNVTQTAMTDPDSCPSSVVNVAGGAGGSCIVCLPQ